MRRHPAADDQLGALKVVVSRPHNRRRGLDNPPGPSSTRTPPHIRALQVQLTMRVLYRGTRRMSTYFSGVWLLSKNMLLSNPWDQIPDLLTSPSSYRSQVSGCRLELNLSPRTGATIVVKEFYRPERRVGRGRGCLRNQVVPAAPARTGTTARGPPWAVARGVCDPPEEVE